MLYYDIWMYVCEFNVKQNTFLPTLPNPFHIMYYIELLLCDILRN